MQSTENVKSQIRCILSNVYDLQKLRIQCGNRLVQSFYTQLGIEPGTSPDAAEKDAKKLISNLKSEYSKISDGIASNNVSLKKQLTLMGKDLSLIKSEMDYKLVESYMLLIKSEEESTKVLEKYVIQHPLWDKFFKDVKGCGPLMSAVCIAYFDIYKARYVSSFYRYAGLDTVQDEDKEGNKLFLTQDGTWRKVRRKVCYTYQADGSNYFGRVIKTGEFDADGVEICTSNTGEILDWCQATQGSNPVYEVVDSGEEYIGEVVVSEHGRRKGDTEMVEYIDKNGNKAMKRGITYNPVLKTKLMGVLTGCLLKAKDPVYSEIYYDYRKRLDNSAYHSSKSDGARNMMAQRYMIKQFLRNLWVSWRELEGLEVNYPYEVAKLGNKPHKYNQYQCDVADKFNRV